MLHKKTGMRQSFVMGNWKMNGDLRQVRALLAELLLLYSSKANTQVVVFPPAIYLSEVARLLSNTEIQWGAQNVYSKSSGAYTGELAASMLSDYACRYTLVGHSERRNLFQEDEKFVAEKFHQVKDHDMIPVLCVGETINERQQGITEAVLTKQILAVVEVAAEKMPHIFQHCVIAYEPVWAIGTGLTPTPEQVQAVHAFIRKLVATVHQGDAEDLSILYGGSVNEKNVSPLFAMPDVDGVLVGGASLNAQQFVEIVKCIN